MRTWPSWRWPIRISHLMITRRLWTVSARNEFFFWASGRLDAPWLVAAAHRLEIDCILCGSISTGVKSCEFNDCSYSVVRSHWDSTGSHAQAWYRSKKMYFSLHVISITVFISFCCWFWLNEASILIRLPIELNLCVKARRYNFNHPNQMPNPNPNSNPIVNLIP